MIAVVDLLSTRGATKTADATEDGAFEDVLSSIDHEEQAAGYQASFSRLAASEAPRVDPVAYVSDPIFFLRMELGRVSTDNRGKALLGAASRQSQGTAAFLGP